MAENIVNVGPHFLDSAHLDDVLERTLPKAPPDATLVWGGGVDKDGLLVALAWSLDTRKQWVLKAAFAYDWSGDKRFAIGGSFTPK